MYSITDLKKDTLIQLEGIPYKVIEYAQKQMGRGGSIVNVRLKNLLDGSVIPKTFKGQEKIQPADVDNKRMQYLYAEANTLHFMDEQTYDQLDVQREMIGDPAVFLKEGSQADVQMFSGRVINVALPIKVELVVTESPDVVKGDTQSTVLKEVTVETGAQVQTPMFVKTGDTIVIDTRDGSYVERKRV